MSAAKVTEFKLGKGSTATSVKDGPWTKKYLELTVRMPDQYTDKDLQETMLRAEYVIDEWLGGPETPQVPEFNSEDLMKHEWKGKKVGEKTWNKGSLAFGWDFRENFKPEILKVLDNQGEHPLVIDEYEFTANESIVQTRKKKNGGAR